MYEDLLTLGFLASFEMLSAAFSPGLELGLAAWAAWWPPYTLAVVLSPFPRGGAQSSISLQLTSVQLPDSRDGWCLRLQDAVSSH